MVSNNSSVVPCLVPNSDVAGIGVVVAYSIHTVLIIVLCLVYFWFRLRLGSEVLERYPDDHPRVAAVGKLLVDIVDTQSILALALVVGAYAKSSPTSAYHLRLVQLIINLNTLAVLLALGFTVRRIRLPWYRMLSLVAMLLAWVIPASKGTWADASEIVAEAACFGSSHRELDSLRDRLDDSDLQFGAVMMVFLIFFVVINWAVHARRARNRNENVERATNTASTTTVDRTRPAARLWRVLRVLFYYHLAGIAFVAIVYVGKTIRAIVLLRSIFTPFTGKEENEWGYGQVLALALLVQPAMEFIAALFDGPRKVLTDKVLSGFEAGRERHIEI